MSNNNCLPHWETNVETIQHFASETLNVHSPLASSLKESDIFIKSQVSMADTACDDHSPISHKF